MDNYNLEIMDIYNLEHEMWKTDKEGLPYKLSLFHQGLVAS